MTNEKSNGKRRTLSQSEVMMDFRKWHETNDIINSISVLLQIVGYVNKK